MAFETSTRNTHSALRVRHETPALPADDLAESRRVSFLQSNDILYRCFPFAKRMDENVTHKKKKEYATR